MNQSIKGWSVTSNHLSIEKKSNIKIELAYGVLKLTSKCDTICRTVLPQHNTYHDCCISITRAFSKVHVK